LDMAAEAFRRGWTHVKTYFMIGLPTERDEDVEAIADLCIRTLHVGRAVRRGAVVRTGVSTFVPKPCTPFQWSRQIDIDETRHKQALLLEKLRKHPNIKFGRHAPEASFIEGLITRADRRAADLIEAAWRHGARLETWDEHLNIEHWRRAIEETGFDWRGQLRERDPDERLPWDHIDVLIPKSWFQKDWRAALELKYAQDCRAGKCHLCGVIYRERELCRHMLKNQEQGHREEEVAWGGEDRGQARLEDSLVPVPHAVQAPSNHGREVQAEPAQRIRFRIGRVREARLLSHLEVKDAWVRALRRAKAPLAYSQGFHQQPRVTFSTAAPVGEESEGDYMDAVLRECVGPGALIERLRATLPPGFHVHDAEELPVHGPSLMSLVTGFDYEISVAGGIDEIAARVERLLARESLPVARRGKAEKRRGGATVASVDIRDAIASLRAAPGEPGRVVIHFTTAAARGRLAKPKEILQLLGIDAEAARVFKRATHLRDAARESAARAY
ncbi:MAG TPA: TIGR03936 family radical SAM-associated protein, partial [Candidatus Hydrogenedentes bacterium]|nr:TIGR03936 family radical SAM-associated protein [Candidatus Hydrogenedentota bacterium]